MIYVRSYHSVRGFALPTMIISSIMLMMVLLVAVSATVSIRAGLYAQYYNKLAREAAESGAEYAMTCLRNNDMIAPWGTTNKTLTPATDCSGNVVSESATTVFANSALQTRFSVSVPQAQDTVQYVVVNGYAELKRSSGAVWKTYTQQVTLRTGSDTKVNNVTFGYNAATTGGVFFTVIDNYGRAKSVGSNSYGQLGFGIVSSVQSSPVAFNTSKKAVRAYANFVSIGKMIFVKDEVGDVWGAGDNSRRALGNATAAKGNISTPVKFQLPSGVSAKSVSSGWSTFVLASDNNIYAAGDCDWGMLGTNYTASTCQDQITPKRVALPTPVASNANTIPTDQIVQDRNNAYVIMSGGAVYGWGVNDLFQLGSATLGDYSSVPVKIGNFGDSGKPKAIQIAFNGDTFYIVANDGKAYAVGFSMRGETGQKNVQAYFYGLEKCMDDQRYAHTTIQLYNCNGSAAQTFEFNNYGAIKVGGKCLDNNGYNKVDLQLYTCNGTAAQTWRILLSGSDHSAGRIELNGTNKCVGNYNGDKLSLKLITCDSGDARQNLKLQNFEVSEVVLPAQVAEVATDQMFAIFRLKTGEVYGVGDNTKGSLGNYSTGGAGYLSSAVRFELPTGVKAVSIYSTAYGFTANNNFVVGDDGKVYGAGDNQYGQLGNGVTSGQSNTPVVMQIFGASSTSPMAKSVQSGDGTTVIFTTDGAVYTVGNNDRGQLGDGTTLDKYTPIKGQYTNVSRAYLYY